MSSLAYRLTVSLSGALFLFALAFMLIMLAGCATTSRLDAVTRTTGVQCGQPVDLVATTHAQSEGTVTPDPQVITGASTILTGLGTGGAAGVAVGLAALWMRERKLHAATAASDSQAWNMLAERTPVVVGEPAPVVGV